MGHCCGFYHDLGTDHDRAAAGIHDDLGRGRGPLNLNIFELGDVGHFGRRLCRGNHPHGDRVEGDRRTGTHETVDRGRHIARGGKVCGMQIKGQGARTVQGRHHLALNNAAVGNAPRGFGIHRNRRTIGALGAKACDDQGALGHGVHFAIASFQLRHQQFAAAQALGITQGRYRDIKGLARLRIGRQCGRHHNGCDILGLGVAVGRHVHAKLLQHGTGCLQGKGRLGDLVTGTVQAHHQSKTYQLVGSGTLKHGKVFNPLRPGGAGNQKQHECRRQCHNVDCSVHREPAFL